MPWCCRCRSNFPPGSAMIEGAKMSAPVPGADPGTMPGATGETGTSGACGTTSGLLGLKVGVAGGGSRGGNWATALAANSSRIGRANSPRSRSLKAKCVPVLGLSRNGVVLDLSCAYRDPARQWQGRRQGRWQKRSVRLAQGFAAISASFATVFMLRAVPDLAAGILSLERPMPLR